MTDEKDKGTRAKAMHDATTDLDAAPAVDMAYHYFKLILNDNHGEGYADAHPKVVAAMIQAAALVYRAPRAAFLNWPDRPRIRHRDRGPGLAAPHCVS